MVCLRFAALYTTGLSKSCKWQYIVPGKLGLLEVMIMHYDLQVYVITQKQPALAHVHLQGKHSMRLPLLGSFKQRLPVHQSGLEA